MHRRSTASWMSSPSSIPAWRSTSTTAASRTTRFSFQLSRVGHVTEPIRVLLVEDNDVFREALELLLELRQEIDVAASVGDGETAAAIVADLRPDVVLMDYRLP